MIKTSFVSALVDTSSSGSTWIEAKLLESFHCHKKKFIRRENKLLLKLTIIDNHIINKTEPGNEYCLQEKQGFV